MSRFPLPIQNLINEFAKLPGIGRKTAERFVFYLMRQPKIEIESLQHAIANLQQNIHQCLQCGNLSEKENLCPICSNANRDAKILCVVEQIHDLNVIEETHEYHGLYHVLGGVINPIEGITEDQLNVKKLLERIKKNGIKEVILAFNPDMQGEATIIYLKNLLSRYPITTTRLARGLPMGSDIEYADEVTLSNALKGRKEI